MNLFQQQILRQNLYAQLRRMNPLHSSQVLKRRKKRRPGKVNPEDSSFQNRVLIRVLEGDCPSWIRADITPQEIREVASSYTCPVCILSKRRAKSIAANLDDPDGFYGGINSKNAKPGQIISIDPVGPISPKSINGFSLMWLVYDIGSS